MWAYQQRLLEVRALGHGLSAIRREIAFCGLISKTALHVASAKVCRVCLPCGKHGNGRLLPLERGLFVDSVSQRRLLVSRMVWFGCLLMGLCRWTAELHLAALNGHTETAKALLADGANVHCEDHAG